jgi:hypothetical protein
MTRKTTTIRFALLTLVASLSTLTVAQSEVEKAPPPKAGAQESFDKLKALAGAWAGPVTTLPQVPAMDGKIAQFSLRVTSMGNALVHELSVAGRPDHPVTMFYLDGDRLLLTHYCDAGNRPRMASKTPVDGKTLEFDLLDVSGGNHYGHMHHAVFTFIDPDHHTEDWTYMGPGDQPVRAHFDLQRTSAGNATASN